MKKNLRMLVCLVGGATLFGMGCGGAPEEMPTEQQPSDTQQPAAEPGRVHQQGTYMVCWGTLGLYTSPSTSSMLAGTLSYGNHFATTTSVFSSNGEYWVRGYPVCTSSEWYCNSVGEFYVRWAGLC